MNAKLMTVILATAIFLLPYQFGMSQTSTSTPAVRTAPRAGGWPTPGANSFTEGQAQTRIEAHGFESVTGLQKDDTGIWRGLALKGGVKTAVALDFRGDVFSGPSATVDVVNTGPSPSAFRPDMPDGQSGSNAINNNQPTPIETHASPVAGPR